MKNVNSIDGISIRPLYNDWHPHSNAFSYFQQKMNRISIKK